MITLWLTRIEAGFKVTTPFAVHWFWFGHTALHGPPEEAGQRVFVRQGKA